MNGVKKCVINDCRTNQITKKTSLSIPTFKLPTITSLKHEWLKATIGTVWNKNSKICIKHFKEDDIIRYFKFEKKGVESCPLKSPKIRPGAIPSVFNINLKAMEQEEGDIFKYCELENKDSKKTPKINLETKNSVFNSDDESILESILSMKHELAAGVNKEVFSKNIGIQCNLIEELWVQRVNKENCKKKCSCIEEFLKHLKFKRIDDDPLSINNFSDNMLDNNFDVEDLYNDPWKIEEEILGAGPPASFVLHASTITPVEKKVADDKTDANMFTIAMNSHDSQFFSDNDKTVANTPTIAMSIHDSSPFSDDDNVNLITDDITDAKTSMITINTHHSPTFSDDDSADSMPEEFIKPFSNEKQTIPVGFLKDKEGCFECRQCAKKCQNLAAFKAHAGSHSEKSIICFKCGLTFTNSVKMRTHSHHCNYDEKVPGIRISRNTALRKENLSHSLLTMDYENLEMDDNSKKNIDKTCILCNKSFTSIRKYFDHMNVHSGKKPYKCNSCRSQFSNHSNFLAHAKKYKCSKDGLIQPKYAPKGRVRGEFATENPTTSTKSTVYYKCRICSFVGARDSYTKHFKNNNGHLTAVQNWLAKFNIHEFLCQYCRPEKKIFKNLYACINHSRKKHRKFPSDKFLKWFEENQWIFSRKEESADVDLCLICKIGLSEKEFGDHLCTSQHLEKEKVWLGGFKINQLKCSMCPEIEPFLKLFDLMMHHIEEHVTNPNQQLTIKDFISKLLNPSITIILPNDNGDIVTENGQIIPTKDVGCLEYVKEKNGKYLCRICKLSFVKRIHYFDHQVMHKGIKPYKCACGIVHAYYESFLTHNFKNNCSIVGRKMPGYAPKKHQYLGSDSKSDNDKNEKIKDCSIQTKLKHCCICDSSCEQESFMDHFNTEIHLKAEIEWKSARKSSGEDKRITCKLCRTKFEKIYAFVKHRAENHNCQLTEDFISTVKYTY